MKRKIILAAAPVGGWGMGKNNPVLPEDLMVEIRECAMEGAALLHLHSRDKDGKLSADTSVLERIINEVSSNRLMLVEASTGGLSAMTDEERSRPVDIKSADFGSLNMGSLNFGDEIYRNALPSIRYWIEKMKKNGVVPSLEIFDTGHLETALALIKERVLNPPYNFSFIFNCNWGMRYSYRLLKFLESRLPEKSSWGCIFAGNTDFTMHLESAICGAAFLRTGFEDSIYIEGREAVKSSEIVRELRQKLEILGFEAAGLSEARERLISGSAG